jgi:hypothetical protein
MRPSVYSPFIRSVAVVAVAGSLGLVAGSAAAAPPWVDRHLTPPAGDFAFDVGLGVGHVHNDPGADDAAAGINAEMAVGVTDRVEIGVRTGARFGDRVARSIGADEFGRLFDRQTFAVGGDAFANPELRVRGAPVRGRVVELAVEGRIVFPFESGTDAGLLFGLPLAFHLGARGSRGSVRLDTGVYVPVVFQRPTTFAGLNAPLDVWIQASPRVWLGPMTGVAIQRLSETGSQVYVSLGFGLGYQATHYLDFKAMVLFPTLNSDSRFFGAGAGVELRIE